MAIGQLATLPYCEGTLTQIDGGPICAGTWKTATGFLIDPSQQTALTTLLTDGPVDWATVEWIFGSGLVLFAVGAGVGAIVNVIRKARV